MGNKKMHLLFAAYMAGGNATIFDNLHSEIGSRQDITSSRLPIELDSKKLTNYGEKKSFLIPGTIRNSYITSQRIHEEEKKGVPFDAAYFFQHTICIGLVGFRRRVPYVIAMDGTPRFYAENEFWYAHPYFQPNSLSARIKHILTRGVYRQAFHLLPLSTKVRDSLIRDYQIPAERITVVPPGIDVNKFSFLDRGAENRSNKPFNVLFIGADFVRKGGDLLVSVAAEPEFKDTQFNIITRSYSGPKLSNVMVHNNISTNTSPMIKLLHEADIFVLPTHADSFSVASLEAMATGLPVITVAVGGIGDIVEEGKTGYLIPKNDVRSLARSIRTLKENSELRHQMGVNGRKRIESKFSNKVVSDMVVDLLQKATESKNTNR